MFTDDVATTSTPPPAATTTATATAAASNSGEEDKNRVFDETERGFGGNRWPRQETLALLKIRSDMDSAFRDASVKGPLWEEVSRKLAGLGYHRSAKKCKEKFENVYKYHRRTKDGRTSKGPGKTYRFFDQLEAFGHHHSPSPPQHKTVSATVQQPPAVVVSMPGVSVSNVSTVPSNVVQPMNLTLPSFTNPPTTNPTFSFQSTDLMSDSTSSSTSSDLEVGGRRKRKRKWKEFFDRLMKEVIDKQEELQRKFLETIEKREQDRVVREEAWRMQELNRINTEREILAQERKLAAAKDSAVMAFLQKLSDQQPINNSPPPQPPPSTTTQTPPPPPPPQPQPPPPPLQQQSVSVQPAAAPQQLVPVSPPGFVTPAAKTSTTTDNGGASSSRWPKIEVEALINLRTTLDSKYQENGPKGPLWEEISNGMKKLGYNRSSKRCKEKWENINKYFKKVKESNKKRPEDSKTCPYFHQLDALYRKKGKFDDNNNVGGLVRAENSVPLMVQPEQQWPPAKEDEQKDSVMEDVASDEDEDGGDDDDEEDDGFEIVPNKQASMNAAQ